jgi:four helix bundle protein
VQRRSTVAANLAEGCGKRGNGEFQRFLNITCGSASELEDHFLLARDLVFLSAGDCQKLNHGVVELKRMLAALAAQVEAERLAGRVPRMLMVGFRILLLP